MSESYFEVEGRVVGNSQIEQHDAPTSANQIIGVSANAPSTKIHDYITIVPQKNPRSSFVLDVTDVPSFQPGDVVKIRIIKEG